MSNPWASCSSQMPPCLSLLLSPPLSQQLRTVVAVAVRRSWLLLVVVLGLVAVGRLVRRGTNFPALLVLAVLCGRREEGGWMGEVSI